MQFAKYVLAVAGGLIAIASSVEAAVPLPWQMNFQPAASPVMERIEQFHNMLLVVTVLITLFVMGLLLYVMVRFRASRNPVPSKTTHHTLIEVLWTVLPIVILVGIAIPSFRLLYYTDRTAEAEMTLKIIGSQWYWSYEYPDHGNLSFDSVMIPDKDIKPGQHRLLEVDNRIVLPVDTNIRLLMTATDVLHAWAVPAFGVKLDTVPGRINETWVRITREGVYYGQCSELCGVGHAYMPIAVEAVSKEKFEAWAKKAKAEFGSDADRQLADAGRAN
ncbi:MAG: cytochrome c oxidase subunit II [Alphaproteobacteria bacterium]|nr:cytochrome c oxidase subunit II [Alphaproteobacteria bacterium]